MLKDPENRKSPKSRIQHFLEKKKGHLSSVSDITSKFSQSFIPQILLHNPHQIRQNKLFWMSYDL